jgi:hypothetical protein
MRNSLQRVQVQKQTTIKAGLTCTVYKVSKQRQEPNPRRSVLKTLTKSSSHAYVKTSDNRHRIRANAFAKQRHAEEPIGPRLQPPPKRNTEVTKNRTQHAKA